jgi:two-component system heavy metal sensor histidine kinase CusS
MCWKNAETRASAGPPGKAPRGWSVARRFTLLYVASTAVLLLLAVGFLDWALNRTLDISRQGLIANKIEVLRLMLRDHPERTDLLALEVEHEASASHALKYYIRVLDEQGRVQLETSEMKDLLPVSLFPSPTAVGAQTFNIIKRLLPPRRSFVLLAVEAPVGAAGVESRTLQVALDVSTRVALMADYHRKLLLGLVLGLVFAAVVGSWLARKGAQPLVAITERARHITASQLHERIVVSQWPAELAALAGAFNAMLDRLEDSFARLSEFSGDLAHALRTPINNLRGEAEVALARRRAPEEYQHILASSLEELDRLSRMIDGLLFVARADDPKTAIQSVRFSAQREVEAVREFYEALAEERGVAVTCEGTAWLSGDPMLVRRAVSNLLGNALRYTAAQGTIRITVCDLGVQGVALTVGDSGSGIAPEHLGKIFDRFYRADDAPGGSGLGLAIVQSIMRLHGGSVAVQSQVGQGSTFTLKFPAGGPAMPQAKMTGM